MSHSVATHLLAGLGKIESVGASLGSFSMSAPLVKVGSVRESLGEKMVGGERKEPRAPDSACDGSLYGTPAIVFLREASTVASRLDRTGA